MYKLFGQLFNMTARYVFYVADKKETAELKMLIWEKNAQVSGVFSAAVISYSWLNTYSRFKIF